MQRALIQYRNPKNYYLVKEALEKADRQDLIGFEKHCLIRPYPPGQHPPYAASRGPRKDAKGGADAIAYPVNLPDNILALHPGERLVFRIAEGTGEVTPGETDKDRRRPGKDTLPLERVKNLINAVNFHSQSFS